MNSSKHGFKLAIAALLLLVTLNTYNVLLFVICGFFGHGLAFWCSYVFMHVSILSFAVCGFLAGRRKNSTRDWFFGIPILRHCIAYLAIELITSIVFMLLDEKEGVFVYAFVVQFLIFVVHLVFILSCFVAKKTIEDIQTHVEKKTFAIGSLKVDAEMVSQKAKDTEIKNAYAKLADKIRFSDPMSSDELVEIEERIKEYIKIGDQCVNEGNKAGALNSCEQAMLLLNERNQKCMIYKSNKVGR